MTKYRKLRPRAKLTSQGRGKVDVIEFADDTNLTVGRIVGSSAVYLEAEARLMCAASDLLAALKDAAARMQMHAETQSLMAVSDADRHYANECARHARVWREVIAEATGEA